MYFKPNGGIGSQTLSPDTLYRKLNFERITSNPGLQELESVRWSVSGKMNPMLL